MGVGGVFAQHGVITTKIFDTPYIAFNALAASTAFLADAPDVLRSTNCCLLISNRSHSIKLSKGKYSRVLLALC